MERRLAEILAANIVGCSWRMAADQPSILKMRKDFGMLDQRASILSRIVFSGVAGVLILSLTACATQQYGRATPVSPRERSLLTCEQIAIEIEKVEFFIADIQRQRSETSGAHVVGALLDLGIGNLVEGDAAESSGKDRLRELKALQSEKECSD